MGIHLRVSGRAAGRGQLTAGGIPDPAPGSPDGAEPDADRAVPPQLFSLVVHIAPYARPRQQRAVLGEGVFGELDAVLLRPGGDRRMGPVAPPYLPVA